MTGKPKLLELDKEKIKMTKKRYSHNSGDGLSGDGGMSGVNDRTQFPVAVNKYSGDKFFRYFNLLKDAKFGFSIRKSAILNYLKIKLGMRSEYVGVKTTCPAIIYVFALKRCNLKCSFCEIVDHPADWKKHELTPEEFTKILSVDIVKKALVICFSGGEPLLHKDLPELVKMAKKHKYIVGLNSNGLLLNERIDDIKNIGISDIQLSVYNNTKEKLRKILPLVSQYFPLNASYVLTCSDLIMGKDNGYENLVDTIKMCAESGCASFKFNICQLNSVTKDMPETIYEGNKHYKEFVEICKTVLPELNFAGYGGGKQKLWPSRKFTVFFPFPLTKDTVRRSCMLPWTVLDIWNNGEFDLCCGLRRLGNILDDPDSINNEKARRIKASLLNPELTLENECLNCVFRDGAYSSNF